MDDPYDDDDDAPPDPWEIGSDDQCSCELCYIHCDAREPWCHLHSEYIESVRYYEERRKEA